MAAVSVIAETVRSLPIFVEEVSIAQVGNSGAANGGDARERGTVWRRIENAVNPAPAAFERGALVRCAEENKPSQVLRPSVTRLAGVIVGTAGQQAAVTVTDDRQLPERRGPLIDEGFEQSSQSVAVGGDVQ